MSRYSTSLPQISQTRLYRIRPPSSGWTWWNRKSCSSVEPNMRTAMVTSPNEIAPLHTGRMSTSEAGQTLSRNPGSAVDETGAQLVEALGQQAGHVHLADPQLVGDLGLGEVAEEPQRDDLLL